MRIDLNNQQEFTLDGVRALLASQEDATDIQLRVSSKGIAYLEAVVGPVSTNDVLFRMETWNAGEGYVGKTAANDDNWVHKIYNTLKRHWPKPHASVVEPY